MMCTPWLDVRQVRQRRNYKFVYKRKIFLPAHQAPPSEDPMFKHLMYLQLEDEAVIQVSRPV